MSRAPSASRRLWGVTASFGAAVAGAAVAGAAVAGAAACGDVTAEVAATRGDASATGGAPTTVVAAGAGGGGAGQGASAPGEIATCGKKIYQCGDLLDNDADGLVDAADPECLGPCDNTEDSFYGGIPGQNQAPCRMDCYFDADSGHGTDDCFWSHKCDPLSVPPHYYPEPDHGDACAYDPEAAIPGTPRGCEELAQTQSETCLDVCLPLTPNGCDCFGCCELPASSGSFVWLGSVGADGSTLCTADAVNDPTICHPCTPVPACFNACEPCEYCVGKTTLPPGCDESGPRCDGLEPCNPDHPDCPSKTYCVTGCCVPVPS